MTSGYAIDEGVVKKENVPGKWGFYMTQVNRISMQYMVSPNQNNGYLYIDVYADTMDIANVDICLQYEDGTVYRQNVIVNIEDLGNKIDNMAANADPAAFGGHDLQGDIDVMFSRFVTMGQEGLSVAGCDFAGGGFGLGSKYASNTNAILSFEVDPNAPTPHTFANGICTDCGESWVDYVKNCIIEKDADNSDKYHIIYGDSSNYFPSTGRYVMLETHEESGVVMMRFMEDYPSDSAYGRGSCEWYLGFDGSDEISFSYEVEDQFRLTAEQGVFTPRYRYTYTCECNKSELASILASKDQLMARGTYEIFVEDTNGIRYDFCDEETLIRVAEEEGCSYLTQDQVMDRIVSGRTAAMNSLSASLASMQTSFDDSGMNYK